MENITKKIHRKMYKDFIHNIDEELTVGNIDGDIIWELNTLFFEDVKFTMNNSFKRINFQMKYKILNGEFE